MALGYWLQPPKMAALQDPNNGEKSWSGQLRAQFLLKEFHLMKLGPMLNMYYEMLPTAP